MFNKIKPGDVCIFDKDNSLDIVGEKITWVKVLKITKQALFTRDCMFNCVICDRYGKVLNETVLSVPGIGLVPNGSVGDNVVYRYPESIPVLNKKDLDIIQNVFERFGQNLSNEEQLDFAKLIAKVKFFSTIIHSY